ncbi:MAG: pseudouridine synthase [Patescibacteria group bacterium]|nr:pseudouridine synthase [Patescibacteria group bacterium]
MRINRFLARAGVASRRKAEELVKKGSVFVNGEKITNLATEIDPDKDEVVLNGNRLNLPELKYYLLNKPKGYMTTRSDPHAKRTIYELLPPDTTLFSVGRLDKDTTGLIAITNDGDFAQNMIHPSKKIEKEYLVTTKSPLTDSQLKTLSGNITLSDGPVKAKQIKKITNNKLRLVIDVGRNRIVRRMIKAVGNEVRELERVRIGSLKLDVPLSKYRKLSDNEVWEYLK